MANFNKKISDTNVRLGLVRFAYVHVFDRRRNLDGTPGKYEVVCIFPKSDKDTKAMFDSAFEAAKALGVSTKWQGKMPKNLQGGLRDGDEKYEENGDEAFKGCWYFSAKSTNQPGIRVREDGVVVEALDADDLYSGCYGCVSVNLYPYNASGNVGVAAGLQNIIKIEDGERLTGGRSADQDFSDLG